MPIRRAKDPRARQKVFDPGAPIHILAALTLQSKQHIQILEERLRGVEALLGTDHTSTVLEDAVQDGAPVSSPN